MTGSKIIMTPNTHMTTKAWEEMVVDVCIGVRSMNSHIQEMEEWWCLEIFDGVGSHLNSLTSMWVRRRHQILPVKEEGDSSYVNQAYDCFVAK
eukprot:11141136-Ditylum_brightwellii.AAC.1